jgi:hypothetical protein
MTNEDTSEKMRPRGVLSTLMHKIEVGQCIKCPPGIPRWPHQTVNYHNRRSKENGNPHRWSVRVRKERDKEGVMRDVFRIHRVA